MNSVYKGCHSERPEGFRKRVGPCSGWDEARSSTNLQQTRRPFNRSGVSKDCPSRPRRGIAPHEIWGVLTYEASISAVRNTDQTICKTRSQRDGAVELSPRGLNPRVNLTPLRRSFKPNFESGVFPWQYRFPFKALAQRNCLKTNIHLRSRRLRLSSKIRRTTHTCFHKSGTIPPPPALLSLAGRKQIHKKCLA